MAKLAALRWLRLAQLAAIYIALTGAAIAESPLTSPVESRIEVNVRVVPAPFDPAVPSSHYDGLFVGKNMLVYPTPDLSLVEAFAPPEGVTNANRVLISINGIGCDVPQAVIETEAKAAKEGCRAVCLYDDSAGSVVDVLQAAGHKINLGESKTVATLKSVIVQAARRGDELCVSADSRGSVIVSRALMLARTELQQCGLSEPSIGSAFSKLRIATTGGVAFYYPDGPKYVHYICRHDAFAPLAV